MKKMTKRRNTKAGNWLRRRFLWGSILFALVLVFVSCVFEFEFSWPIALASDVIDLSISSSATPL